MMDIKTTDQFEGHEISGHENDTRIIMARHEIAGQKCIVIEDCVTIKCAVLFVVYVKQSTLKCTVREHLF